MPRSSMLIYAIAMFDMYNVSSKIEDVRGRTTVYRAGKPI